MKIKMTKTMCGASNNIGSISMNYISGNDYDMSADSPTEIKSKKK